MVRCESERRNPAGWSESFAAGAMWLFVDEMLYTVPIGIIHDAD